MSKRGKKGKSNAAAQDRKAPADAERKKTRARRGLGPGFFMVVLFLLAGTGIFILSQHQFTVGNELKIEKFEGKIASEKVKQKSLRIKIARLRSPSRIVRIAQDKLGMVEPGGVIYLKYGRDSSGHLVCQSSFEKRSEIYRIRPEDTQKEEKKAGEASSALTQR